MTHMTVKDARNELVRMADEIDAPILPHGKDVTNAIETLRSAARALHRIALDECNGVRQPDGFMGWTEANQAAADEKTAKQMARVNKALNDLFPTFMRKVRVAHQGDPRGPSVAVYMAEDKNGSRRLATFW